MIKDEELRIAIFIRGLHNVMGGAEKQLLKIAFALAEKGFLIKIITLDNQNPELFFKFSHENISLKFIGKIDPNQKADFSERIRRQIKLYKILRSEKFNVGIAFMTGAYFFSVIPCRITGTPIILSERNSPSMYYITRKSKYKSIIFLSMLLAKSITIQFSRFKQNYPRYLQSKFITIPNQIDTIPKPGTNLRANIQFIFAGRIFFQKQICDFVNSNINSTVNYVKARIVGVLTIF